MSNFTFIKRIEGNNAQGSCGLIKIKKPSVKKPSFSDSCRELIFDKEEDEIAFYKYGNNGYNCTLSRIEYIVAQNLLRSCSHIPNFMRPVIYAKNIFIRTDRCKNPFEIKNVKRKNKIICSDIAAFEYIPTEISLYSLLKKPTSTISSLNSVVMQICLAVIIAQQKCSFVHNDLHSQNILIAKCDPKIHLLYKVKICNEDRVFLVPTFGFIPIIIDYGFSFSEDCKGMSLECIDSDNFGFITYQFDNISDFIRLFVVLANSNYNKKLSSFINEQFKTLPISMNTSWENLVETDSCAKLDNIFVNYCNEDLSMQYLRFFLRNILLPLKCHKERYNLEEELEIFFNEWDHIEKWLKYNFEKIYIMREFCDSVRKFNNISLVSDHINKCLLEILDRNLPIFVNWELLVTSSRKITKEMENVLFTNTRELEKKRIDVLYKKLVSGEHMFKDVLKYLGNFQKHTLEKDDIVILIDNDSNYITDIESTGEYTSEMLLQKFITEEEYYK